MATMDLSEIHHGIAKFECLLTQLAAKDKTRAHEISQALPKLHEARVWVEGALEKEDPISRQLHGGNARLFPGDQAPLFLSDDWD